jgi:hypothetical protein
MRIEEGRYLAVVGMDDLGPGEGRRQVGQEKDDEEEPGRDG